MIQSKQKLTARISSKENLKANLNNKVIKIYPELEDLEITPSVEEQKYKSSKYGYDNVTVKAIESEELNIVPSAEEQVKEGLFSKVTVAGVVEKGGVKLFNTVEEMHNSTNNNIDDLAVVYGNEIGDLEVGQTYTELYLPKTITLNSAITATTNIYFSEGTSAMTATHWVRLTKTAIQFYVKSSFSGKAVNTVNYSSSDGITYTRTDSLAEILSVSEIYQDAYSSITIYETNFDILAQMFKAHMSVFGGFYKYGKITSDGVYFVPTNNMSLSDDNKLVWNGSYNGGYDIPKEILSDFITKCEGYCVETNRPALNSNITSAFIFEGKLTRILYTYTSNSSTGTQSSTFSNYLFYDIKTDRWWVGTYYKATTVDTTSMELLQYDEATGNLIVTQMIPGPTPRESIICFDIIPETIPGYLNGPGTNYIYMQDTEGNLKTNSYSNLGIDGKYRYYGYEIVST